MKKIFITLTFILLLISCSKTDKKDVLNVATTITFYEDLIKNIGQDKIEVKSIMGIGEDPHIYTAKPKDYSLLKNADIVIYSGIHLEGKLTDILESANKNTYVLADSLSSEDILGEDPHIWFSIRNYKKMANYVKDILVKNDPSNKLFYEENLKNYLAKLDEMDEYIKSEIAKINPNNRVLITAHDAFSYYAKDYGIKVYSIQGISTVSEASIKDIENIAKFIADNKIKSVFVESSISDKSMLALSQAVKNLGFSVELGNTLYSDSMGKEVNTYLKVMKHNTDSIVKGLK